jgi:hypothetical protein
MHEHAGQNPQTFCREYCISREIVLSDDEIYELVKYHSIN